MRSGLYVLRYSHFFEVLVIARCPFDLSSCFMYLLHSCRSYHSTGWNSKADYWWKVNHAISWLQIFSSSFDLICQYLQCSYEINLLALFKLWYLQQVVRYLCDFWVGPHMSWHLTKPQRSMRLLKPQDDRLHIIQRQNNRLAMTPLDACCNTTHTHRCSTWTQFSKYYLLQLAPHGKFIDRSRIPVQPVTGSQVKPAGNFLNWS